jgi:hypothetical protein
LAKIKLEKFKEIQYYKESKLAKIKPETFEEYLVCGKSNVEQN